MSTTKDVKIEAGWKKVLAEEFQKEYFGQIKATLVKEKQNGQQIFPPGPLIFNAFDTTPFAEVKVVILGQDPYHGPGQAMGLCFSVPQGVPAPPSLDNIFKEQMTDVGIEKPNHGDLMAWAKQGVFLLNAGLTVRAHQANSHKDIGWHTFTDAVIRTLSEQKTGLVFLLWGGFAKKKASLIDGKKHHILTSGHPSPLSANRGYWFGNKHFSKTNALLKKAGQVEIDWQL